MDLGVYVETLQRQVAVAAEAGGDEARAVAERLTVPLEAAIRLTLQDAVTAAAEEITCDLAPGSVEVRLRGRELEYAVPPPPAEPPPGDAADASDDADRGDAGPPAVDADEGATARINLRLPDHLKARIEQAAAREGLSVNTWLVRAAAGALGRADPDRRRPTRPVQGTQRYTGWAR
jgi:antitoxin component of RelBE/YafQ-DinJ toxin-antitoxin module